MVERARAFVFTMNNYGDGEVERLMSLTEKLRYIIFGEEIAPTTGTPHLQGYAYFKNPQSIKGASKVIGGGAHLEIARGSVEDNVRYTSKEGNVHTFGDRPTQGSRTDIERIKTMVMEGKPMKTIIAEATSYQSLRTAELLMKYAPPPKREPPTVMWFYGATGTGKTRKAVEMGGDDYWISGKDMKWWDGYCGQKTVIIDDFRGDFCTFHELLRILDRYPYRVQVKGSSLWLQAETIIVTAPKRPEEYYKEATDEAREQLMRRITHVRSFEPEPEFEWPDDDIFSVHTGGTEVAGNTVPRPKKAIKRTKKKSERIEEEMDRVLETVRETTRTVSDSDQPT